MDTDEQSIQIDPNPSHNRTLFGVLSYLGPLVLVSLAVAKSDPFIKFHIKQGLVLLAIEVAVWIVGMTLVSLWMILSIVNLGVLILSIIGIINVLQNKEKPLPLVGQLANLFSI